MFFETIAHAQAAPAVAQGGVLGMFGSFLPLVLIIVIFYFLLIRPQQKRQKQHIAAMNALKAGDEILTNGGIYGVITSVVDANTFMVEITSGTKVKVAKGGIASKVTAEMKATTTTTPTAAPTEPNPTGVNKSNKRKM